LGVEAEEEVAAFVVLPVVPLVPLFEVTLQHCIQFLHEARVNVTENGPPDDCSVGFTIAEVGIVEIGIAQVGTLQIGKLEVGRAQVGRAEISIAENDAAEDGTSQVIIAEVGMVEIGIAQVGTIEIGIAQVSIAQVGFAEIRLYVLMLLSPGVPGIYALVKKVEMLLTCHHVLLACSALTINKRSLIRKSRFLGLPGRFAVHGTA
jgi:hypothetical protein